MSRETLPTDPDVIGEPSKADSCGSSSVDTDLKDHAESTHVLDQSPRDESHGRGPIVETLSSFFTLMKQSAVPHLFLNEEKRRSDNIDAWLKAEAVRSKREFRVMLLGDVEQVDIFWKQARLLSTPLSEQETVRLRGEVRQVMLRGFKESLCELLQRVQGEKHKPQPGIAVSQLLQILREPIGDEDAIIAQAQRLISICQDPEIYRNLQQEGVMLEDTDRHKLGLEHSATFSCTCEASEITLNQLHRAFAHDYQPTEHDWFHFSRHYYSAIRETCVQRAGYALSITDLSTRVGRRDKLLHVFDACTCIIFLANMARYCDRLCENETQSVLEEFLPLFESVANSPRLVGKPLLLILTHLTIFKAKLASIPLSNTFPDYAGHNAEEAAEYILNRFVKLAKRDDLHVYVSDITTAESLGGVLENMETSVLKNALEKPSGTGQD